jgi:hypothetical protein
MGLRERTLTLPVIMALLLSAVWRQIAKETPKSKLGEEASHSQEVSRPLLVKETDTSRLNSFNGASQVSSDPIFKNLPNIFNRIQLRGIFGQ